MARMNKKNAMQALTKRLPVANLALKKANGQFNMYNQQKLTLLFKIHFPVSAPGEYIEPYKSRV